MKNDVSRGIKKSLIIIDIIFFIYAIVLFIFKNHISTLIQPLNVSFFMLLCFFSAIFLGFPPNKKTRLKIRISNIYIVFSILYLITIYLAGNATGYIYNEFKFLNTLYLLIYLVVSEVTRYIILSKTTKNSDNQYVITILFVVFDILVLSPFTPTNLLDITTFLTLIFLSLLKNTLLSYTTYKYGYFPCIIFSFIMSILPNLAPIYPKLGNYLSIVFTVVYSAIVFYNISKPNRKEDEETVNTYIRSFSYYLERILLILVFGTIALISGAFRFSLSAIASDSMYPALKRGDAILLEKADDKIKDSLKKGDIVAFNEDGTIVTHRILTIEEENEITYFITKGDNNSTKDVTKKTKDDIIGIVRFKIPLLGYPSVEISEIKKNN